MGGRKGARSSHISRRLSVLPGKTFNQWLVRSRGRNLFLAYSQLVLVILSLNTLPENRSPYWNGCFYLIAVCVKVKCICLQMVVFWVAGPCSLLAVYLLLSSLVYSQKTTRHSSPDYRYLTYTHIAVKTQNPFHSFILVMDEIKKSGMVYSLLFYLDHWPLCSFIADRSYRAFAAERITRQIQCIQPYLIFFAFTEDFGYHEGHRRFS